MRMTTSALCRPQRPMPISTGPTQRSLHAESDLHLQGVAQNKRQKPHPEDTGTVAESPLNPYPPGASLALGGVRGHGRQVIGSRQHMNEACNQPRECERHATHPVRIEICSALRSALATRLRERGVSRSFQLTTASSTARSGRLPTPMKKAAAWSA